MHNASTGSWVYTSSSGVHHTMFAPLHCEAHQCRGRKKIIKHLANTFSPHLPKRSDSRRLIPPQ